MIVLALLLGATEPTQPASYDSVRALYDSALAAAAAEFPETCATGEPGARIEAARSALKTLGAGFYQRRSKQGDWEAPPFFMVHRHDCSEAAAYAAKFEKMVEEFRSALARF